MVMPAKLRRFSIIQDEVKLAHTSHWDLDYLGQAEFDALMNTPAVGPDERPSETGEGQGTAPSSAK
ncbi:MAG: hypothetical protein CVU19_16915 [Betaproteobacteria bacterium HGW-Betaproteobacteria-13]|jgi:hypothetical protein|nr:MAG: hypothetical protein CVU19_16915 [Betaproteobacteria bacterium HGW-Betaproteobacteria-13]